MTEEQYKELVVSMGCIITGQPAEPHHVKCFHAGWGKVSDFLIIPLCPELHTDGNDAFHHDQKLFEMKYGYEWALLAETIQRVTMRLINSSVPF